MINFTVLGIAMQCRTVTTNEPASATYLFSHGIADTNQQAHKGYTKKNLSANESDRYIINNEAHPLVTFDYPDAGEGIIYPRIRTWSDLFKVKAIIRKISYRVDRAHTDFAGSHEIRTLANNHAAITENAVVGIGVSRGASALVTWLGTHDNHQKIANIKALVLESPFDSMDSIVRNIIGEQLCQYSAARKLGHDILKLIFYRYNRNATTPLQAAESVPLHIPIIIICSEEDARVPAWSSEKLYNQLISTGHTNVHLLKIKRGLHGKLIQGPDGETYRNAVHAFYQKYHLPHNAEWAELGKNLI